MAKPQGRFAWIGRAFDERVVVRRRPSRGSVLISFLLSVWLCVMALATSSSRSFTSGALTGLLFSSSLHRYLQRHKKRLLKYADEDSLDGPQGANEVFSPDSTNGK